MASISGREANQKSDNVTKKLEKLEYRTADLIQDMASLTASYNKINEEMGAVRDRMTKLETNYQWVKWLSVLIASGVIGLVFKAFI